LRQIDGVWQEHLEVMKVVQDGIHLESMASRKPEEVFVERGFEIFQETLGELKKNLAKNILPAAAKL